jgi:hypothetical protein
MLDGHRRGLCDAWSVSDLYQGFKNIQKCKPVSVGSDEKLDVNMFSVEKDPQRQLSSSTKRTNTMYN